MILVNIMFDTTPYTQTLALDFLKNLLVLYLWFGLCLLALLTHKSLKIILCSDINMFFLQQIRKKNITHKETKDKLKGRYILS